MSAPSSRMRPSRRVPCRKSVIRLRLRSSVLLPLEEGPISPRMRFAGMSSVMLRSAAAPPG